MHSLALRLLVLLLALAQPIIALLVELEGTGFTAVLDRYPALVMPASPALLLAVPIFALDIALGVLLLMPLRREDPRLDRITMPVAVGMAATAAWMFVFDRQQLASGVLLALVAVSALAVAAARAQEVLPRRWPLGRLVRGALGLHLGFASVLVLGLIDQTMHAYGWGGFGLDHRFWAYFAVAMGGFAAAGAVSALRGNLGYAVGAITAFAGVALAQWVGPRAGTAPALGTAALFASVLVAMSSMVAVAKRASDHRLWVRRGRRDSTRSVP